MSDIGLPVPTFLRLRQSIALIVILALFFGSNLIDFVEGRYARHNYDTQARLLGAIDFRHEFFDDNGPMLKIYAPGKPVHNWKEEALGYWAQKQAKDPLMIAIPTCIPVGQEMVLHCKAYRLVWP